MKNLVKNPTVKIALALNIVRKFNSNVNVQRTEDENAVYLFDYSTQKKTIGSPAINKAVEKAVKQQDWPKDAVYSEGMLFISKPEIKEVTVDPIQTAEPVKRTRKKKETVTESEPIETPETDVQTEETEDEQA